MATMIINLLMGLLIRPNLDLLLAPCAIGNAVDGKSDPGGRGNDAD
jgi:hypothetical protein